MESLATKRCRNTLDRAQRALTRLEAQKARLDAKIDEANAAVIEAWNDLNFEMATDYFHRREDCP